MESKTTIPSQFGKALKAFRKERNVTQVEVARKAGLLPKTVSALENHPQRASLESVFRLLAALDLELVLRPRTPDRRGESEW